jgi:hypothetical protein
MRCEDVNYDVMRFEDVSYDGMRFEDVRYDGMRFEDVRYDGVRCGGVTSEAILGTPENISRKTVTFIATVVITSNLNHKFSTSLTINYTRSIQIECTLAQLLSMTNDHFRLTLSTLVLRAPRIWRVS